MSAPFRWSSGSTDSCALRFIAYAGLLLGLAQRYPVRTALAGLLMAAAIAGLHELHLLGLLPIAAGGLLVSRAAGYLDDALDCEQLAHELTAAPAMLTAAKALRRRAAACLLAALLLVLVGGVWLVRAA